MTTRKIFVPFLILIIVSFSACVNMAGMLGSNDPRGVDLRGEFARIPAIPPGNLRLYGALASRGIYYLGGSESRAAKRGNAWGQGVFGNTDVGNTWFYADIDWTTGAINSALFYTADSDGGSEIYINCDKPLNGSFGKIGANTFSITLAGVDRIDNSAYTADGRESWDEMPAYVRIFGKGDLLALKNGAKIRVQYQYGRTPQSIASKNPDNDGDVWDYGGGIAAVEEAK